MSKISHKSDIARQFDLPERQSKLNTMLREEGLRDEQVYCICRSTDVSRFMIGCDKCEEWYHGDCIKVTEQEANKIRKFFCKSCQLKHPGLKIKYKDSQKLEKHGSSKKKKSRCGECEACYVREDCGRCENCKDMAKFGGSGQLLQKCKKRQCHNFFHLAKKHQSSSKDYPLSGSKEYPSVSKDHSFSSKEHKGGSKEHKIGIKHHKSHSKDAHRSSSKERHHQSGTKEHLTKELHNKDSLSSETKSFTIPLKRLDDKSSASSSQSEVLLEKTSEIIASVTMTKPLPLHPTSSATSAAKSASSVLANRTNKEDSDEDFKPDDRSVLKQWTSPAVVVKRPKPSKKRKEVNRKRKAARDSDSDVEDYITRPYETSAPRQCLGPQCIKAARPTSKYCTEDCGLKLASARIYSVLPQRIQEWKMRPCEAEDRDRKQLEKIRCLQLCARKTLEALDVKHKDLDAIVQRSKAVCVNAEEEVEGDDEGAFVYCVTCGHEVPVRRAIRHMHSCYNKLESQMSFGSMFKTRIEGNNMFCDFFNPSNSTYCKRLRVMCPEHTKEPKLTNTEVCGFPLTKNIFEPTEDVCCVSKKKCVKHYCWEKLRRANIDMERVRQCLKLDELVEQERQVRLAMTNRAGVLGLLLHSTYDHEYAQKMQIHQTKDASSAAPLSDHHYHRNKTAPAATNRPVPRPVESAQHRPNEGNSRAVNVGGVKSSNDSAHHDHGYFSSKLNNPRDRKDDHIYFSNKKVK